MGIKALPETLEPPQHEVSATLGFPSVRSHFGPKEHAGPCASRRLQVTQTHPRGHFPPHLASVLCAAAEAALVPSMCYDTLSFNWTCLQKALKTIPGSTARSVAHALFTSTLSVGILWPLCQGLLPAFACSDPSCCMFWWWKKF